MADLVAGLESLPSEAKRIVASLSNGLTVPTTSPDRESNGVNAGSGASTDPHRPINADRPGFREAMVRAAWPAIGAAERQALLGEDRSDELLSTYLIGAMAAHYSVAKNSPRMMALAITDAFCRHVGASPGEPSQPSDENLVALAGLCERHLDASKEARRLEHEKRIRDTNWWLAAPVAAALVVGIVWLLRFTSGFQFPLQGTVVALVAGLAAAAWWYRSRTKLMSVTSHLAIQPAELGSVLIMLATRAHAMEFAYLGGVPMPDVEVEPALIREGANDEPFDAAAGQLGRARDTLDAASARNRHWQDLLLNGAARIAETRGAIQSSRLEVSRCQSVIAQLDSEIQLISAQEQQTSLRLQALSIPTPAEQGIEAQVRQLSDACANLRSQASRMESELYGIDTSTSAGQAAQEQTRAIIAQTRSQLSLMESQVAAAESNYRALRAQREAEMAQVQQALDGIRAQLSGLHANRTDVQAKLTKEEEYLRRKGDELVMLERDVPLAPEEAPRAAREEQQRRLDVDAARSHLEALRQKRLRVVDAIWTSRFAGVTLAPGVTQTAALMRRQVRLNFEALLVELHRAKNPLDLVPSHSPGTATLETPYGQVDYGWNGAMTVFALAEAPTSP